MQVIGHMKRINRDIHDLMNHDFQSESASVLVEEVPSIISGVQGYMNSSMSSSSARTLWSVNLTVCPFQGPYRGGHFLFTVKISDSYPFMGPDVWVGSSSRPIWHPNIDMDTGRVMLPLEWSPVLTLIHLVLAIQMMLLEPSADHPLNLEACSYYTKSSVVFEQHVQRTLNGYQMRGTYFVPMRQLVCKCCMNRDAPFGRSDRGAQSVDTNLSHLTEEFDMIMDTGSQNDTDSMDAFKAISGATRRSSSIDGLRLDKSPKKRSSTITLDVNNMRQNDGGDGTVPNASNNNSPFGYTPKRKKDGAEFPSSAEKGVEGSAHKRSRTEGYTQYGGDDPKQRQPVTFGRLPSVFLRGASSEGVEGIKPHNPLNR